MTGTFQSYLSLVRNRLLEEGFDAQQGQVLGKFPTALIWYKRERVRGYTIFCYLVQLEGATMELLEDYSHVAYEHASKTHSVPGNVLVYFPVVVASTFGDGAKESVSRNVGQSAVWRWGIGRIEHPVLAELNTERIYHYDRYPFLTSISVKKAAKLARGLFSFGEPQTNSDGNHTMFATRAEDVQNNLAQRWPMRLWPARRTLWPSTRGLASQKHRDVPFPLSLS